MVNKDIPPIKIIRAISERWSSVFILTTLKCTLGNCPGGICPGECLQGGNVPTPDIATKNKMRKRLTIARLMILGQRGDSVRE